MKKLVFGLALSILATNIVAGDGTGNCYDAYNKKFAERGANKVDDGWHEDVVITFRQGDKAECLLGKVQVEKGLITQIFLRNVDGTYQLFTDKWKHEDKAPIVNGISKSRITVDNKIVNVIFRKSIKPPKKKVAVAPSPDDL